MKKQFKKDVFGKLNKIKYLCIASECYHKTQVGK